MKPVVTWIVIADGGRARVLANSGPGKGLTPVAGLAHEAEHLRAQDIMADKPGRSFASAGRGRSRIEPHTDPVEQREIAFVQQLAATLDDRRADFDRLLLVAAPSALGELRAALSTAVKPRVMAELPKDLTRLPNADLPTHLDGLIAL